MYARIDTARRHIDGELAPLEGRLLAAGAGAHRDGVGVEFDFEAVVLADGRVRQPIEVLGFVGRNR